MSNILRRPMFRGGRVESRGTGITSGLGYNKGGRVGYNVGGNVVTGAQLLNAAQSNPLFSNLQFNPKSIYPIEQLKQSGIPNIEQLIGTSQDPEQYPIISDFINNDLLVNANNVATDAIPSTSVINEDKEVGNTDIEVEKSGLLDEEGNLTLEGQKEINDMTKIEEIKTPSVNIENNPDNEINMTDLEKALGLDKARKRDVEDFLASFSAAALKRPARGEERNLTDILGDFMSSKVVTDPSRTERIKSVAGLEEYKTKKALDLYRAKLKNQQYAPGNAQKNYEFYRSQGVDKDQALNLAMGKARNFDEAYLEQANKGTLTAKSFDILARQENIKELPDVDVEQLPVGEIYYKKNEKTLVKIVSKNGKKVPIATPY